MSHTKNWHDVNDPGVFKKGSEQQSSSSTTQEESAPAETKESEVRLKKATWKEGVDGFEFNKECFAIVEGEYLKKTTLKRITGNLFVIYDGKEEDLKHEVSGTLEDSGTAEMKVKLFYGQAYGDALDNNPDAKCNYILKNIKHARGEAAIESEKLEMPAEAQDGGMIFFVPGRNEYLVVQEADLNLLIDHVKETSALADETAALQAQFKDGFSGDEAHKKAAALEKKVKEAFKGIDEDPKGAIEELIVVTKNPRWGEMKSSVYIAPQSSKGKTIKGHWHQYDDKSVKKKFMRALHKEKENPKFGVDVKIKKTLIATPNLDTTWPWEFKFPKKEGDKETNHGYFSGSAEAKFLRFVAGASADYSFDLKERKLSLKAQGELQYSLAEGTVSGSWSLPAKEGYDFFSFFRLTENSKKALITGRVCLLRLTFEAKAKAFVGAAITASVALPNIDLGKTSKKDSKKNNADQIKSRVAETGGQVSGFVGGSAGADLTAKGEWSSMYNGTYESLTEVKVGASGKGGLGAEAKLKVSYTNGKFHFEMGAMAVLGLGAGAEYGMEVGVEQGVALLSHIFWCIDYRYLQDVMGDAFVAFRDYSFVRFKEAGDVADVVAHTGMKQVKHFGLWLDGLTRRSVEFASTKSQIKANIKDPRKLKNAPPETLGGQVLKTIMATVEADDFDAIVKVLQSANSDHELKWILRCVVDYVAEDKDGQLLKKGINQVLEFGNKLPDHDLYTKRIQVILRGKGIQYE